MSKATSFHKRFIAPHEIQGYLKLGLQVESKDSFVVVSDPRRSNSSFNRIINIHPIQEDQLASAIQTHPAHRLQVLDLNRRAESKLKRIAEEVGLQHTSTHQVIGGPLKLLPLQPALRADRGSLRIDPWLEYGETGRELPGPMLQFLQREGEPVAETLQRLQINIRNGTHFLAYVENSLVGMMGSIDVKPVSLVYSAYVLPDFRHQGILKHLLLRWVNHIFKQGFTFIYTKTQNPFVGSVAKDLFGFDTLYNEQYYSKR